MSDSPEPDVWSRWLLHDRHGGDALHARGLVVELNRHADRVLDGLSLRPGMTLLDIGTGDGLVALRAIERVGAALKVVLTDVSAALLAHVRASAEGLGVLAQCAFIAGSAERLQGVGDASVDAVTTRAVLAYVPDKRAALSEIFRVLTPGGQVSIAEPMLQDEALNAIALRRIAQNGDSGANHRVIGLLHRWKSAQFPDTPEAMAANPLVNYSERDLLAWFQEEGFEELHLELHLDVRRREGISWATFLASSPHPLAPTLGSILNERFGAQDRQALEQLIRPAVEAGVNNAIERIVYLTARKPVVY